MPIRKTPPERSPMELSEPQELSEFPDYRVSLLNQGSRGSLDYIPLPEGGYMRAAVWTLPPSSDLPPYKYEPLPESSEYIRCLILEPGQKEDEIVISLEPLRLRVPTDDSSSGSDDAQGSPPAPFEALSYTWGTPQQDYTINCEGHAIFVTRNLYQALQSLRRPTGPARRLWADSVCINQNDPDEKGPQVALMGTLYSQAERVLIYLGSSDFDMHASARSLIRDVVQTKLQNLGCGPGRGHVLVGLDANEQSIFNQDHELPESLDIHSDNAPLPVYFPSEDDPLLTDKRWAAFSLMLRQIWFTRGWTVQEAWLAREAVVLWGEGDGAVKTDSALEVSWLDLMRTYLWSSRQAAETGLGLRHELKMADVHATMFARNHPEEAQALGVGENDDGSILHLLKQAKDVSMTDPRDRIFAFKSLISDSEVTKDENQSLRAMKPNYKESYHSVYLEFARRYIRLNHDSRLLSHVMHNEETLMDPRLPSWVPRWDLDYHTTHMDSRSAGETVELIDLEAEAPQPAQREWALRTRGILMDTIEKIITPTMTENFTFENVASIILALWTETTDGLPCAYAPHMVTSAVLRCLVMGNHAGHDETWPDDVLEYCEFVKAIAMGQEQPPKEDSSGDVRVDKVHDVVKRSVINRVVVRTARGYYGLAPSIATEGDVVAVFSGGFLPITLRSVTGEASHANYFKVIGQTWVESNLGGPICDNGPGWQDWKLWDAAEEDIILT